MFTGIVEELGSVDWLHHGDDSAELHLKGPLVSSDAAPGASISCNGVCLTVVDRDEDGFSVFVMAETLTRSSLGDLRVGSPVNLERAMAADSRFGGHVVQGHVDGTSRLLSRTPGDRWEVVRFELPEDLARYVVEKGSIAVDGVSLTVSAVGEDYFEVSLIPTTMQLTTLGRRRPGERVNLEVDVLAKYVEKMLGLYAGKGEGE